MHRFVPAVEALGSRGSDEQPELVSVSDFVLAVFKIASSDQLSDSSSVWLPMCTAARTEFNISLLRRVLRTVPHVAPLCRHKVWSQVCTLI
jgi:hypothetical protein